MRTMWMYNAILGLLVGMSSTAVAEDQGTKASIEKKLTAEYALTKTTDDKTDIVTAGAVVVLQKDKVYMAPTDATANPCQNNYKDGKLSQSGSCKVNETFRKIPGFGHVIPGQDKAIASRAFVTGEKFWLTKIDVRDSGKDKDKGVMLEFFTDAIKEVRYTGTLMIQFKSGLPTPEDALKLVAEVITVAPSEEAKDDKEKPAKQGGGKQQEAPAAAPEAAAAPVEAPPPAIEAPPPPPAEPATVALGQTPDEVVAALGQPTKKAKVGTREIYFYKDLKVTFLNGKVKDIQ